MKAKMKLKTEMFRNRNFHVFVSAMYSKHMFLISVYHIFICFLKLNMSYINDIKISTYDKKKYQYNNDKEVTAKNTEDSDHKCFHLEIK